MCPGRLSPSLSLCGSEKSWLLMGEVIKSGVVATFPLQGEVQSQPKGGEGEVTRLTSPPPLLPSSSSSFHSPPCPSTKSPTPCLGSLGLGGGQGSRRQPLDSALRERSLGLLTQWHYLSSSLGYCSGEHFLSLCKHFLSLA